MKKTIISLALAAFAATAHADIVFTDMPSPMMEGSVEGTKLKKQLRGLKVNDVAIIYFNSVGGEVGEGVSIAQEMLKKADNIICVVKNAFSMAAYILPTCKNIALLTNSKIIIHAVRDLDDKKRPIFTSPGTIELNKKFREIVAPLLTDKEEKLVYEEFKDLEMTGEEFVNRLKIVNSGGEVK